MEKNMKNIYLLHIFKGSHIFLMEFFLMVKQTKYFQMIQWK